MNYEKIILELLDRIKVLEEKVKELESNANTNNNVEEDTDSTNEKSISLVQRARDYINGCKRMANDAGNVSGLILRCNDIQKDLGVTNRAASICQAMYDCMLPGDEVIEAPQSGKSTTVTICYHLDHLVSFYDQSLQEKEDERNNNEVRTMTLRQLRTGFEDYFNRKKPDYKYPGPLFGMAFYITKHNIGVTLQDMISGKVSLDEYSDILYKHFYSLKADTATVRTSAYKDAMKNLLEYIQDMHFENVILEK